MRKISVSVFLSVVDLCVVCQGKPPHPPPMGLICNVYTGSPPHDKRCRGTHSWCLLTLVPAPPEKVIPLQYPGKRSCSSSLDKFECVTRHVSAWPRPSWHAGLMIVTRSCPRPSNNTNCWLPRVGEGTNGKSKQNMKEEAGEGNWTCKKFKYWWFLC